MQGDVAKRRDRVAQGGLEGAVELDDVQVRNARREVLAEHAEAAADLQHDVVGLELRGALDDAEHVRVDEEVLTEVAFGADGEVAHAAQARLAELRLAIVAHHPNSAAALRSTSASSCS